MSFSVKNGRLLITDVGGAVRLDTNKKLLHILSTASKTIAFPTITVTERFKSQTDLYLIGSCHPACTDAIGAIRFTLNNYAAGMAFDRWHTMLGGTALWVLSGYVGGEDATQNFPKPRHYIGYTIKILNSKIYLERRMHLSRAQLGSTFGVFSHSISCNMQAGAFT